MQPIPAIAGLLRECSRCRARSACQRGDDASPERAPPAAIPSSDVGPWAVVLQSLFEFTFDSPAAPVSAKGAKDVAPVQPQVAIAQDAQWNGWMQGSGLFSDGGLSLNPGEDFDSGTFMVGADFAVSEHVSLGVFASYQEGWGDYDNGGDMDLESVRFGGYATCDLGGFYASGAVGGGTTDYSVKRPIQWATLDRSARSDPDGTEFFTLLGTGYNFHAGNFTFGPSLSAQYTKLKLNEFTESGADTLDLRVRDAEEESLRTYLGGRIAYTIKVNDRFTVIPELRAFWEHEFLQSGENLNASLNGGSGPAFSYVTEDPGKDAMCVLPCKLRSQR